MVIMTVVASGMVAYTTDVATYALHVTVGFVEDDTCYAVIKVLFVPTVEMAGQTSRIVARIFAALVVTVLALQHCVVRLQFPAGFGVIEQVVRVATVALLAPFLLVVALVAGVMQVDVGHESQGAGFLAVGVAAGAGFVLVAHAAIPVVVLDMIEMVKRNPVAILVAGFKFDQIFDYQRGLVTPEGELIDLLGTYPADFFCMAQFAMIRRIPFRMAVETLAVVGSLQPRLDFAVETFRNMALLARRVAGGRWGEVMAIFTSPAHFAHQCMLAVVEQDSIEDIFQFVQSHHAVLGQITVPVLQLGSQAKPFIQTEVLVGREFAVVTQRAGYVFSRFRDVTFMLLRTGRQVHHEENEAGSTREI
jgi:hypothetical protein